MFKNPLLYILTIVVPTLLLVSFVGIWFFSLFDIAGIGNIFQNWDYHNYYFGVRSLIDYFGDVGRSFTLTAQILRLMFDSIFIDIGEGAIQSTFESFKEILDDIKNTDITAFLNFDFTTILDIPQLLELIYNLIVVFFACTVIFPGQILFMIIGWTGYLFAYIPTFVTLWLGINIRALLDLITGMYNLPLNPTVPFSVPTWFDTLRMWQEAFQTDLLVPLSHFFFRG